jgi:CheY-like chemotaxis protein
VSKCGVVIVNCFPDEREMYVEYLKFAGYDPVDVCDVDAAFQTAVSIRPSVIITDIVLPGADGLELIRSFRTDPRTQTATIVVVTGRIFQPDRAAAERAGCDVFLPKPCLPDTLLTEVDRACAGRPRVDLAS